MYKKTIILFGLTLLTGCAAGNLQNKSSKVNQNQAAVNKSSLAENPSLRVLYKPKVVIGRDLKGTVTKEVLQDYTAQVPQAQESADVKNYCSQNGLTNVIDNQNNSLVDVVTYSKAMALGKDIAQKRAAWKFYVDQTNKANQAVPRGRYEQTKAAREQKAQREKDAGYVTKTGRVDSRKLSKDILRGLGLENDPVKEKQKAEENAYEEFKRDIEYNRSILTVQDQQISILEQNYVNKLSEVYQSALNNLTNIPAENVNPETLKQFSNFRTNNIYVCIYERTSSKVTWPKELMDDRSFVNSPYEKYASSVILTGAKDAVKKINSSTTSSGIETEFHFLYPTEDLKRVAFNTPSIGEAFKTRSSLIKAEEKRKYEELQKRLAAEAIKQAKVKIKNNSIPSESDLLRAVLYASAQETNIAIKNSRTEITSSKTYEQFDDVLGHEFKGGEMMVAVKNHSCRKEGKKQKCSYDEISKKVPYAFGLGFDIRGEETVRRENLFYWTMEGLVADKNIEVVHFNPPSGSRSTYGSSCAPACDNPSASDRIQNMYEVRKIHGLPTWGN